MTREVNFDGLVGPTHNYAGLSLGNRASMGSAGSVSSPRRAALQGLAKMRLLTELGVTQGVLPPQRRPDPATLAQLGFTEATTAAEIRRAVPGLVATVMSASSMWAANAATVSPSLDTADGRVHLTPANLSSTAHRSFESGQTQRILRAIFADPELFHVHPPLPMAAAFADEGAANHGRFAAVDAEAGHGPGTHLFVYGREPDEPVVRSGFPRRQTRLAGELVARSHGLDPDRSVFARQASAAIDAGAFHNDVVSVVNDRVLFTHELAFDDLDAVVAAVGDVSVVEVRDDQVPLTDAVSSYLFNSQLVTVPDGTMVLIAPAEVEQVASTAAYLEAAVADVDNPISAVHALDLRESMRNGGGPACLRLRVVLTDDELAALSGRVVVDESLLDDLERWVERHYRDELEPDDLVDPRLAEETERALDELTDVLELGDLYGFRRD